MSKPSRSSEAQGNDALKFAWGKYREYAATSRRQKASLMCWRRWVLVLGIAGAVLSVLSEQSMRWGLGLDPNWIATVLGILAGLALGLAALIGRQKATPGRERVWIRARSLAESFKGEAYLFLTNAPPYDLAGKDEVLFERAEELLKKGKNLETAHLGEQAKTEPPPEGPWTVDDYIKHRVDDQVKDFYRRRAKELGQKAGRIRNWGFCLGFLGLLLGVLGALSGWTAAWVAVVSTIAVSIAAYAYANRYEYLVVSYQATANRLELLKAKWAASKKTEADTKDRNDLILACEEAISVENSAWMAEIGKGSEQTQS